MKDVYIFCDGGCRGNPGIGGWGTILQYTDPDGNLIEKELSGGNYQTTNNKMELTAVIKGLQALKEKCNVTITTDSQYVVNGFNKGWIDSWVKNNWKTASKQPVKNQELWQDLLFLVNLHSTKFVWVKGHNGHPENERCDALANQEMDKLEERNNA